jgi:endonuclease/exonuclease/phosphatase family metal-dependent hydrolase
LHPAENDPAISARVPDGTRALQVAEGKGGKWISIETSDGIRGWVTQRYLERANAPSPQASLNAADEAITPGSPWRSLADCEASLAAGKRRPRAGQVASIGSWNIKWFPDGGPGRSKSPSSGTDIPWLACAIAWLNVDVLAAQELKTDAHTQERWNELFRLLDQKTGGEWTSLVDTCPGEGRQHVGFLYDRKKVQVKGRAEQAALNFSGEACGGHVRPGLSAYFTFTGGLDLHLVTLHLKSGTSQSDFEKRQAALKGFSPLGSRLQAIVPDDDVVVLGDFNTMGCKDCSPTVRSEEERDRLQKALQATAVPLELRGGARCSHYYERKPGLLDHFLVAPKMRELPFSGVPKAYGLCELFSCSPIPGAEPSVERALSDHCPLVLDISDQDLDDPS